MMKRFALAVAQLCCGMLCSCADGEAPRMGSSEQNLAASDVPTARASPAAAPVISGVGSAPLSVDQMISRMDAVGPSGQQAYSESLASFRANPTALADLIAFYASLPPAALGTRWKAVYLAGELETAEALSFLQQIALSQREVIPDTDNDPTFRLRYSAALGIVRGYLHHAPQSAAAIDLLLDQADLEIARLVGLELFSNGQLSSAWRAALDKRNIPNRFRLPTASEREALRVDPSVGARSPENAERLRTLSVPPAAEQ